MRLFLGTPLAVGATAEVYAWETGWVLKLFHAGESLASAKAEARVASAVCRAMGETGAVSAPAVGSVIEMQGRYGLLYQRIEGRPLLDVVLETYPHSAFAFARRLAELHAAIHSVAPDAAPSLRELPTQRERLERDLEAAQELPSLLRAGAQQALARLSNRQERLCHGDFHPSNVLLTDSGDSVVIDWSDATRGDPLADVARTSLLLCLTAAPPSVAHVDRQAFHEAYIARYFEVRPVADGRAQALRWLPVVAAARLSEKAAATEQAVLLACIEANLP